MPVKELAKKLIDALPDTASMDEIMHALYVHAKFARGEQQIRDGLGIPQEEARRRLSHQ